jgi:hypothetical protein
MASRIIAALAALLVAGCAGTDFVRMEPQSLVLGKTTHGDVVGKMGSPGREGEVLKNDQKVRTVTYAYAQSVGGAKAARENVVPARSQAMYFHNDRLVAHEFVSSWADDSTDFDESRVPQIVKGKTTHEEVLKLMGKPAGYAVYPMIKALKGEAAVYTFTYVTQAGFMSFKVFRKTLIVTFDERGVVSDVEYDATSG